METGISLPDIVAGMTRGKETTYEAEPGEPGVAVPYSDGRVEATIFIRRIDRKKIDSPAMVIEDALAAVKQMEASGVYTDLKIYRSKDEAQASIWSKAAFTAHSDQGFLMSLIYATIKADYAVKVRITTANPKNDAIPQFVAEIRRIVDEAKSE